MNLTAVEELQHRVYAGIPLSQTMGFRITALADTQIAVEAPLEPNINVHGTGFAGSLYALGILTAWSLASHIIANNGLVAELVVAEASISFLGFGIPPPTPSWGGMLSEGGRRYILQAPWLALWPGIALAFVVYGINMLGDALRDILDPRLRGRLGRYGRGKTAA